MNKEQREQSKLAIATFIVATGIAVTQTADVKDGKETPNLLDVLNGVVLLAIFISVILALMYILGKASELREKSPKLLVQQLMVKHSEKFYSLAVTIYLPFIGAFGGLITLTGIVKYIDKYHFPLWIPAITSAMICGTITWFWPTHNHRK